VVILASIVAALIGMIALMGGATGRGVLLVALVTSLWIAPRLPLLARVGKNGRRALAAIVLGVAVLAFFWPTELFVVDRMTAVPAAP
jgi:hypothetical protein